MKGTYTCFDGTKYEGSILNGWPNNDGICTYKKEKPPYREME